jgi:hypothetical protein
MHDITRDFLVSLAAFATIFGIAYLIIVTRNRERMSMLEKGVEASFFRSKESSRANTLKFGMLFVGIALGVIMANVLQNSDILGRFAAYFSMTFLFGGLSLILNYVIDRKLNN